MSSGSSAIIHLDPAAKVAEGGERTVYVHPHNQHLLIKVLKPRHTDEFNRWTFGHLTQRYFPKTRYRSTVKQYDEYQRLMFAHMDETGFVPPITHLYGFTATNLGMGGITERVTDGAGNNAPTLEQMVKHGTFGADDLDRLNGFVAHLYEVSICGADFGPANFVYGHRHLGTHGQMTDKQWVLVDGFGDRFAITIRSISEKVRRLGMDDCFKRSKKVAGLRWNPAKRQYQLTS
ncbi:PhoP regulatory network protein YrbL [Cognatiyoonia koreensis]|uniref:PhoP regulatory network protein YrbL n=1 Tax=Cognatiyoonia koreensis TaxID=364200 RepID=A0A1I0RCN0_9RHOB|nr:YrbL family protein [Cognatiyoonia koreensis]SEW38594.1 PhoP regulatory network protein YrbL [Cognatiyoonia koreensis]